MSWFQRLVLGVLALTAGLLVGVMLLFGVEAYQTWAKKPLGPALIKPVTRSPLSLPPIWTPSPQANLTTAAPGTLAAPAIEPTLAAFGAVSAPRTYIPRCSGPPVMNLLAVGSDQRGDSYLYGLGDVIRLVRVDFIL